MSLLDTPVEPDKLTGNALKMASYFVTQLRQNPCIAWHVVDNETVEIVFDGLRVNISSEYLVHRLTKPYGSINYPDGEPKENPLNKFRF